VAVLFLGRSSSTWPRSDRTASSGEGWVPVEGRTVEAMNRLQAEVVDGTYVERSRVTLGEYLE
jgi:hypothetical protein